MKLYELMKIVKEEYSCKLWQKADKCRIYFNHTPKVDTFIELEVNEGTVVKATPKCWYTGAKPNDVKWIFKYANDAREFIEDVAIYINSFI